MKPPCGPISPPVGEIQWALVTPEKGGASALVRLPPQSIEARLEAKEFDCLYGLRTAGETVSIWDRERAMRFLCHTGWVPVVVDSGRITGGLAQVWKARRDVGGDVCTFDSAEGLHRHVLKHVLGLKRSSVSVARADYEKNYFPILKGMLPMSGYEPTWDYWTERLKEAGCPVFSQFAGSGKCDFRSPLLHTVNQLCECHGAIADLSYAWAITVKNLMIPAFRAEHLHCEPHNQRRDLLLACDEVAIMASEDDGVRVHSAYLPGEFTAAPNTKQILLNEFLAKEERRRRCTRHSINKDGAWMERAEGLV